MEIYKDYCNLDVKGKLKNCPFCNSNQVDKTFDDYNNIRIYCKKCGAHGGYGTTKGTECEDAIKLWNMRRW